MTQERYRVGHTKIFVRVGLLDHLKEIVDELWVSVFNIDKHFGYDGFDRGLPLASR